MTVTDQQMRALAFLAVACRPHRAPTWDEAGVLANIAKVRDRSLPEVALAVIRAASDREAVSPGVIPSNGSHWQEQLKPAKWEPEKVPPAERCSACSHLRHDAKCPKCPPIDDHEFAPDFKQVVPGGVKSVVDELRDIKASVVASKPAPATPTREPNPHVEVLRHLAHKPEENADV